jgi:hypothetical protein
MASRPNTRHPKGTLARPTADYFYGNSYSIYSDVTSANPAIVTYLFNGSTDGSMLYVFGISALLLGNTLPDVLNCYRVDFFTGFDESEFNIYPVDTQTPASGAVFSFDSAYSGHFGGPIFATAIAASGIGLFPPGPLTVLRPGYGLQMVAGTVNTSYALNIFFASLPGE